jgi:hypothetical protein
MGRQTNVHNEEQCDQPSVVSDHLVEFTSISGNVLCEIIKSYAGLGYHSYEQNGFQKCSWVQTNHIE